MKQSTTEYSLLAMIVITFVMNITLSLYVSNFHTIKLDAEVEKRVERIVAIWTELTPVINQANFNEEDIERHEDINNERWNALMKYLDTSYEMESVVTPTERYDWEWTVEKRQYQPDNY